MPVLLRVVKEEINYRCLISPKGKKRRNVRDLNVMEIKVILVTEPFALSLNELFKEGGVGAHRERESVCLS